LKLAIESRANPRQFEGHLWGVRTNRINPTYLLIIIMSVVIRGGGDATLYPTNMLIIMMYTIRGGESGAETTPNPTPPIVGIDSEFRVYCGLGRYAYLYTLCVACDYWPIGEA